MASPDPFVPNGLGFRRLYLGAFLGILLLAGTFHPAHSAGPFGGTVTGLVLAADGRSPAWASTTRGLFRYQLGRWAEVEALAQKDLATVVSTGDRKLVIEKGQGLLVSDDGESWRRPRGKIASRYGHRPEELSVLTVDPSNPARLYLGAQGAGVFVSTDSGETWELLFDGLEQAPPPVFHPKALLPGSGSRPLLMGTDGAGVWEHRDGKWQVIGEGLPSGLRVHSLVEDPTAPERLVLGTRRHGLWESKDAGASWRLVWKGRLGVVGAVSVGGDGVVLAHFPGEGLVKIADRPFPRRNVFRSAKVFALVAREGGGWFAGVAHDGVIQVNPDATIGGSVNQGLVATRIRAIADAPVGGGLWLGDENGVFTSAGPGEDWEERDAGLLGAPVNVILSSKGSLFLGSGGQGVFRWDPQPHRWEARSGGLGTANTIFSLVQSASGATLYVGTEGGVLASGDQGESWARKNNGLPGASFWLVAAAGSAENTVWAAGGGRLLRSDDAAHSWTHVIDALPVALHEEVGQPPGTILVLERSRLTRVAEGGRVSVLAVADPKEQFNCLLQTADTTWMGSSEGIWRVAGKDAQRVWSGPGILTLHMTPDGVLHGGTDGRGVVPFKLRRSPAE